MTDEMDDERLAETTSSALRVLTRRPPVAAGWRPADTVRRTAILRRRRRGIGTAVVVAVAAAAAATLLQSGPTPVGSPRALPRTGTHVGARLDGAVQLVADRVPSVPADPKATGRVSTAEQRFSLALLRALGTRGNLSTSPASLYLALAMLQNGARGATQQEIAHALQASGLSTDQQNAGLAGLTDQLGAAAAQDGITLESANSLWQQRGFALRSQFLAELAAYFRTGVWQADFARDPDAAVAAINRWTSQHTHGKITKLFDELDRTTVLVLANAIYFHADWAAPFDGHWTRPGSFIKADGRSVPAKFMSNENLMGAVTPGYQALQLPYRGNRFAALAIMPTHGSLAGFVRGLTPARIDTIARDVTRTSKAFLPKFTLTSTMHLNGALGALGMRRAFTSTADFSGLSPTPTGVSQVIQRTYLAVAEKGTTAAAVTGIGAVASSLPSGPEVRLDHPFLFLVRDTQTGAILFAAQVTDPTAR